MSKLKSFFSILIILLSTFSIFLLQKQYLNSKNLHESTNNKQSEKANEMAINIQKNMPVIGYENIFADWLYLNFIQYFGDEEARLKTGYDLTPKYFNAVLKTDPRFFQAFLLLSTTNSIFAGFPDKTVIFLDEASKHITPQTSSLAQYLWFYKGIDEMLFLGDLKAAKQSFIMAKKWATSPFAIQRFQERIDFLNSNPDPRKAQISGWSLILSSSSDPRIQKRAIEELSKLGVKIKVETDGTITFDP